MKKTFVILLLTAVLFSLLQFVPVQAARGIPGSPEFGYGAWLHLNQETLPQGINMLQDLNLDWVAIPLDWAAWMPEAGIAPETAMLDLAVQQAASSGAAVMISFFNPPSWAVTETGPDVETTAQIINWLFAHYGGALTAVELFPGANTLDGWKAAPNPASYAQLFIRVHEILNQNGQSFLLVAGGLRPIKVTQPGGDQNDLDFLRGLYANGLRDLLQIISLQFPYITGTPLAPSSTNGEVLRHYESVRQVMLENGHENGLVWVTLINVPDGTINPEDSSYLDRQRQAEWLHQALVQMRSQLYMGVVVIHSLNQVGATDQTFSQEAISIGKTSLHPFYNVLQALIQQTQPEDTNSRPGRPKGTALLKCKYKT